MPVKDTGGSAFPVQEWSGPNDQMIWPENGMTLRDWFAGQAMAAFITKGASASSSTSATAAIAYAYAAAMLAERKK